MAQGQRDDGNDDYSYDGGVKDNFGLRLVRDDVPGVTDQQYQLAEEHLRGAAASFARGELSGAQMREVVLRAGIMGARFERE